MNTSSRTLRVTIGLLVLGLCLSGASRANAPDEVRQIIRDAKAKAVTIPGQVESLVNLAWSHEEDSDPRVQAEARRNLVHYGHHVLPVLRRAIPDLPPRYQADAVAAFIEARLSNPSGMPQDYLPGLEETIWYGSTEAQRIALNEIKRYNYPPAVLSSIDACAANPIMTRYVAVSLGYMGDPRARFFLADLYKDGSDFYRSAGAQALQIFGEGGIDKLRAGIRADNAPTRERAMRAFLRVSAPGDLGALRDYLEQHAEDDPAVREAVQKRIEILELRQKN
jgi:hypothetical protein